ncbi:putative DNA repair protein XRCC3 -like protein [Capsicum annuum]|uniref:serine/threonine-protein kinase CDG1-like n=1 Tax=Capsicum annuum TaxID=4072 RepID=UPI001FB158FF|nr:serine/threonine-protein kinase CDG1-like [Capsicum annuum]KAF3622842.1 putative DNA repair protein XRCC3 -like protein [Capsicum annuum]
MEIAQTKSCSSTLPDKRKIEIEEVDRGVLQDGRKVAIQLMYEAGKQGEKEFKVEVELLCHLRSPYLLSLIGYCSESSHKLLVYEFMANGGLQEHLYPIKGSNIFCPKLDWKTRLKIALEAAKGLEYLHEHVHPPAIHRDLKSSNILLDKISMPKFLTLDWPSLDVIKLAGMSCYPNSLNH